MSTIMRIAAAIALLAVGACAAVAAEPFGIYKKGQVRIMPLGDSITNAAGWRIDLQELLRGAGYTFCMVGGRSDPLPAEGYFAQHSGFGGWCIGYFPRSEEFGSGDADWKRQQPELILLMIGTNDLQWGGRAGAAQRLGALLDRIWIDVPEAIILVGKVIPFAPGSRVNDKPDGANLDQELAAYNAEIPAVVAARAAAGRRTAVVDLAAQFDPAHDLADKCHPNAQGHRKMAQAWFAGIAGITLAGDEHPARNLPPVISARVGGGRTQTIAPGSSVELIGTVIDDDGKPAKASFVWSTVCGPAAAEIGAPTALTTSAKFIRPGSYALALTGSDGEASARAIVRVVVSGTGGGGEAAPAASGRSLGIAINGQLAETDAAGVVPRTHWTNVKIEKSWPAIVEGLRDDHGVATTLSCDLRGNNFFADRNAGEPDSADGRLMSGCFAGGAGLYLRGIPYPRYDLHLYFHRVAGKDPADTVFVESLLLREIGSDQWVVGPLFAKNIATPFAGWVSASTAQVEDRKAETPAANHLLLPNLALPAVNVVVGGAGDTWSQKGYARGTLCGVQVVERLDGAH